MWVFFEDGTFYSSVSDVIDADVRWVRTRDRRSADILGDWLGALRGVEADILELPGRDYDYRLKLTASEWTNYVALKAETAVATNFKTEVGKNIGHNSRMVNALHDIWQVMFNYQWDISRDEKRERLGFEHDETADDGWESFDAWYSRNKAVRKGKKLKGAKSR